MLRAILYDPASQALSDGGIELVDAWERSTDALLWLLIDDEPRDREEDLMLRRFGVHELAVADALRERHPPKIESFEDNTFILLKGMDGSSSSLDLGTIQLSLFVGERVLLTRSSAHSVSSAKVASDLTGGALPPDLPRAALALRICRTVADRFFPILLAVEARLEEVEGEMLERPSDDLLGELVKQKGDLKRLLRTLQYHEQVFTSALSNVPEQLANHEHEINDVQEQFDRLLSLARLHYELTDDLMSGYLSLSAHRLNQIMQTLTIVTVIFVPITFMAGIYGMNFEFMPELSYRGAYFVLLTLMVLVVTGILTFFYHRGWLGGSTRR